MNPTPVNQQQLEDKATMRNIRILVAALIGLSAGLIVAVVIIGS